MTGAGHNGLVTACYLARAGLRVVVFERRYIVGGACVTEETFPGLKGLDRRLRQQPLPYADRPRPEAGLVRLRGPAPRPWSFTPLPDGRSLLMARDPELTRKEIAKFSTRDAERYPRYEAMLERVAAVIEPTLTMTPPDLLRPRLGDLRAALSLRRAFRGWTTAPARQWRSSPVPHARSSTVGSSPKS